MEKVQFLYEHHVLNDNVWEVHLFLQSQKCNTYISTCPCLISPITEKLKILNWTKSAQKQRKLHYIKMVILPMLSKINLNVQIKVSGSKKWQLPWKVHQIDTAVK